MLRYFARSAANAANHIPHGEGNNSGTTPPPAENDLATDAAQPMRALSTDGDDISGVGEDVVGTATGTTTIAAPSLSAIKAPITSAAPSDVTCVDFVRVERSSAEENAAATTASAAPVNTAVGGSNDIGNIDLTSASSNAPSPTVRLTSDMAFLEAELGDGKTKGMKKDAASADDDDDIDLCALDEAEAEAAAVTATASAAADDHLSKGPSPPSPDYLGAQQEPQRTITSDLEGWDNVTTTAFGATQSATAIPALISASAADTSAGISTTHTTTHTTNTTTNNNNNVGPASPTITAETVLRTRAKEQRQREDAERYALRQMGRAAEERKSMEMAQRLMAEEEAHLKKAREEALKLEAEEARRIAAELDRQEEEALRRQQQQAVEAAARDVRQSETASPTGPHGGGGRAGSIPAAAGNNTNANTPARRCDCLGASSGFHRQGCPLRQ